MTSNVHADVACGVGMRRVRGMRALDLTGQKFGRWTAQRLIRPKYWECLCECGNLGECSVSNLRGGQTKSCGCFRVDNTREMYTVHGQARRGSVTLEFKSWNAMMCRCSPTADERVRKHYYDRGIYVCPRWHDPTEFAKDMGPRPTPNHEVDRINNATGSYSCGKCDDCIARGAPMNCRWATRKEQMNNTSVNRNITFGGVTLSLTAWAERTGIGTSCLTNRLDRGWSVERALTERAAVHRRGGRPSLCFNLMVTA